jgi:hypothetical protein
MATVVNARDIALAATSPRMVGVTLTGDIGWTGVLDDDGNKPSDNADVTLTTINGGLAVTGGGITLSGGGSIKGGQTAYATGTGFFLGYSGGAYKFSIGDATHYLRWDGTAFTYSGDISGSGDITSSGTFTWTGGMFVRGTSSSGGLSVSLVVNDGGTVDYGTLSLGKVAGVLGQPTAAGGAGVWGKGSAQVGVKAEASSGTALKLVLSGAGKLIEVPAALLSTGANTPALTNCPGSGTPNWLPVYDSSGTKYWALVVQD